MHVGHRGAGQGRAIAAVAEDVEVVPDRGPELAWVRHGPLPQPLVNGRGRGAARSRRGPRVPGLDPAVGQPSHVVAYPGVPDRLRVRLPQRGTVSVPRGSDAALVATHGNQHRSPARCRATWPSPPRARAAASPPNVVDVTSSTKERGRCDIDHALSPGREGGEWAIVRHRRWSMGHRPPSPGQAGAAVMKAMRAAGSVRSGRTRSAPASRSSALDARPLATATDVAPPIFAASTSRGESAT